MTDEKPRLLKALAREKLDRPPVWFMRQAGRFLPEYREIRAKYEFLEVCKTPELACEVTLQPIRRFGFDASIVFSDILVIPEAMGQNLTFGKGMGPRLDPPIRSKADVDNLKSFEARESLGYVMDAARLIVAELPKDVPLIGFSGAPFTVACYMVEGQGSKNFLNVKQMMYSAPEVFAALLDSIVDNTVEYLVGQVEAGCRVLQIFDTWASESGPSDLRRFAVQPAAKIIAALREKVDVPIIYFARGCADALDIVTEAGADAYGLDWRARLDKSWKELGDVAVQGNLDPAALFGPKELVAEKTREVLSDAAGRPGHIFNLGHGILPTTPIESVETVLQVVHESAKS